MSRTEPFAALAALMFCTSGLAADLAAGQKAFTQQCALCHTAEAGDSGGAMGPDLQGVVGRRAGTGTNFSYTPALEASKLVWDAATLDRFLAAPQRLVPGTAMTTAVPRDVDRANIIAYIASSQARPAARSSGVSGEGFANNTADWRNDKPGRLHHLQAANLPPPFQTPSARNNPSVVPAPKQARLAVPEGFKVESFASELKNPRVMRLAPNGDIFLSEPDAGRIVVLRPSADGFKAAALEVFAEGLDQPFGMQFYPAGDDPKWLYVAELNRVVRFPYAKGDRKAGGAAKVVVEQLSPNTSSGHSTRDLAFSPDGRRLFVSVGSESNVAQEMKKRTRAEIEKFEAKHGLGAAWDTEKYRADVLVFPVDSPQSGKIFATGIRNCVGLTVHPVTGDLWCTVNERDGLGDNLVPDYSTRVKEGGFYGWPWYYLGSNEDPRQRGARPDLAGKAIVPDVLYTAHSAALTLTFYVPNTGKSAFPQAYFGEGFAALHGSWNRSFRTGHKIVRVRMKDDAPTGEYEDFLTGFILDDSKVWGRPVALLQLPDGSMLMSDDGGNQIWRISYSAGT